MERKVDPYYEWLRFVHEMEYVSTIFCSILDVSLLAFVRNKLNAKEKELLELQRAELYFLAPDSQ
jgi:hypothetical protein